jgi:hypothetical protein
VLGLSSNALMPGHQGPDLGGPANMRQFLSRSLAAYCYNSTPIFPFFLTHVTSYALSFPRHLPCAPSMCLQITGLILAYVALTCIILFAHALVWFLMAVLRLLITFP